MKRCNFCGIQFADNARHICKAPPPQLVEGMDYYLDDQGRMVFTEKYHLKRGYCCDNGCRHCPFNKD